MSFGTRCKVCWLKAGWFALNRLVGDRAGKAAGWPVDDTGKREFLHVEEEPARSPEVLESGFAEVRTVATIELLVLGLIVWMNCTPSS